MELGEGGQATVSRMEDVIADHYGGDECSMRNDSKTLAQPHTHTRAGSANMTKTNKNFVNTF